MSLRDSSESISIIVPVLNEAPLIASFLRHLRSIVPQAELIVVDGESTDGTAVLAAPLAGRVLSVPRGRARQMNAGAAAATGDVLWFLHVDSELPANAYAAVQSALRNKRVIGGCLRLQIPRRELVYRITDRLGNAGVEVFRIALGDHGIFCRRSAFEAVGGYPEVPILEDAELYRKLRLFGDMRQIKATMKSSARTYERLGRYRTTATYFLILVLYVPRVPISFLNRIYRRLHDNARGDKCGYSEYSRKASSG